MYSSMAMKASYADAAKRDERSMGCVHTTSRHIPERRCSQCASTPQRSMAYRQPTMDGAMAWRGSRSTIMALVRHADNGGRRQSDRLLQQSDTGEILDRKE